MENDDILEEIGTITGLLEQDNTHKEFLLSRVPSVIDKKMLNDAILDQFPKYKEERKILCEEGIDYTKISSLRLESKCILRMEYFWPLINLKELFLNNNLIEEIEGLDLLVHLVRLDLSFNNIEEINGLNKLDNLEDLSLFQNKITELKNMDNLINLQLFSIGNNFLNDFNNVRYLKRLKQLRCLNLEGNPLTENKSYEFHTIAVLPRLKYLNYRLITEDKRSASKTEFLTEYEEALNEIQNEEQQENKEREQKKIADYYKDAMVDLIEGESFLKVLFDDKDAELLLRLPRSELIIEKKAFLEACKEAFDEGIEVFKEREEELKDFWDGSGKVKKEARDKSRKAIKDFITYKESMFANIKAQGDDFPGLMDMKKELYDEYKVKLKDLEATLMKLEMDLVEQIEEFNKQFEYAIREIVNKYMLRIQKLGTILRDHEQQFSEQFKEFCRSCIEDFHKQHLINIDEDMEIFLASRHKVQYLAGECHERRLAIINEREKITIKRIREWLNNIISKIYTEELNRNRKRINEIVCFRDFNERYSLLFTADEDMDDDYDNDKKSNMENN